MALTNSAAELLYAILAFQLDLVSPEDIRHVLDRGAGAGDGADDIGPRFLAAGKLTPHQDQLIQALVQAHLAAHQGDPAQSVAFLGDTAQGQIALQQITSRDRSDADTTSLDGRVPQSGFEVTSGWGGESAGGPSDAMQPAPLHATRFQKIRSHAMGGLGEVSLARDEQIPREVALKQLLPKYAGDPQKARRFVLEAEVTGALEHPGIVPVYALGIDGDSHPYYAMRFIRGDSLRRAAMRFHAQIPVAQRYARNCLEFRHLLTSLIQVCQALNYAHARGVVHRDIKPANIMLGKHGETYVVDWGLAKTNTGNTDEVSLDEFLVAQGAVNDGLTVQGSVIGTPGYMSPEQAWGELAQIGSWSDVYSVGATLYFVLTGKAPLHVTGGNVLDFQRRVKLGDFLSPRQLEKHVPLELNAICLHALAPEIQDRYATTTELAEDLERWMADEPVRVCPPSWSDRIWRWARRNRDWVIAGCTGLILLTLLSVTAASIFQHLRRQAAQLAEENQRLAHTEHAARQLADRRYRVARESVDRWLIGYTEALRHYPGVQLARRRMLEEAAREYRTFCEEQVTDTPARYERAKTLMRLGNVHRMLRDPDQAINAFQAAIHEMQGLPPDASAELPVEVLRCWGLLALAQHDKGDLELSQQTFQMAEQGFRGMRDLAASRTAQEVLATILINRGIMHSSAGQLESAASTLARAQPICENLMRQNPQSAEDASRWATAYVAAGQVSLAQGDAVLANRDFQRASELFATAIENDRENPRHYESLATTHLNGATAARRLGEPNAEADHYRHALQGYDKLVELQPDVPSYREGKAMAEVDFAQAQLELGFVDVAIERASSSVASFENLVRTYPDVASHWEGYVVALDTVATAELVRGHWPESRDAINLALQAVQRLIEASPGVTPYLHRWGNALTRLALTQASQADDTHAMVSFHEAVQVYQRVTQDPNVTPEALYSFAQLETHRAEWRFRCGDIESARQAYQHASELWTQLDSRSHDPLFKDAVTWFRLTALLPEFRQPDWALVAAQQNHASFPHQIRFALTYALAEIMAGHMDQGIASLEKQASDAPRWNACQQWIQAIARARAGQHEQASALWQSGQTLLEKHAPGDWQLLAFSVGVHAELDQWKDPQKGSEHEPNTNKSEE